MADQSPEKKMKVSHDPAADAVFVWFGDAKLDYAEELDDARNLLHGEDDSVVGVELLGVSRGVDLRGLPRAAEIGEALQRHRIRVLA